MTKADDMFFREQKKIATLVQGSTILPEVDKAIKHLKIIKYTCEIDGWIRPTLLRKLATYPMETCQWLRAVADSKRRKK